VAQDHWRFVLRSRRLPSIGWGARQSRTPKAWISSLIGGFTVRKIRFLALSLWVCAFSASGTGIITWSSATLSADNPDFLTGLTTLISGPQYTINLPGFSSANFPPFVKTGEFDVAITAFSALSTMTDIIGVRFSYVGAFTDPGFASYMDSAGAITHALPSFSSSAVVDTINFAAVDHINISTVLTLFLDDLGNGSAAISQVRFDIIQLRAVPEPATIVLLALGIMMLWATTRRRQVRA